MKFADKYNKGKKVFEIDIKDFTFIDGYDFLKETQGKPVKIDGLYINNKSVYGDHPVAIIAGDKTLLDLPSHMTEVVVEILQDAEAVATIKNGAVGLKAHEYTDNKYHKQCVGFEWCDL